MPLTELNAYDYSFPLEAIAQAPANPRDSAKLLVFNRATGKTIFTTFKELPNYLPPNAVLVLNNTKVLPARVAVQTDQGKHVELLYLRTENQKLVVLANKKLRSDTVLSANGHSLFTVAEQRAKEYLLQPLFKITELPAILEEYGTMPLPPYIKHSPLSEPEKRDQYQTVFAQKPGSVAAPTASLHFTPELLQQLEQTGISLQYVTLHVNLGTFASLTAEQLKSGRLHTEYYDISAATAAHLQAAVAAHRPIVAAGTTVVRALESATTATGTIHSGPGQTDLFIRPGYEFKTVDGLITNFHVPRSSLLMLVATLTGRETLLDLYQQALDHQFKLFSFGDGMLII